MFRGLQGNWLLGGRDWVSGCEGLGRLGFGGLGVVLLCCNVHHGSVVAVLSAMLARCVDSVSCIW